MVVGRDLEVVEFDFGSNEKCVIHSEGVWGFLILRGIEGRVRNLLMSYVIICRKIPNVL